MEEFPQHNTHGCHIISLVNARLAHMAQFIVLNHKLMPKSPAQLNIYLSPFIFYEL